MNIIKSLFKNGFRVIVVGGTIYALFHFFGTANCIIVTLLLINLLAQYNVSKSQREALLKVHKNNITNQETLLKEIKRCQSMIKR